MSGLTVVSAVPWEIKTGAPAGACPGAIALHDFAPRFDLGGIDFQEPAPLERFLPPRDGRQFEDGLDAVMRQLLEGRHGGGDHE
jgi:hypothetical protein